MVRINVDGLPFIREMTTPRKLLAGSQLEWLYCPYGGFPIDKITWDKDGKMHPCFLTNIVTEIFVLKNKTIPTLIQIGHFCQVIHIIENNDLGNFENT